MLEALSGNLLFCWLFPSPFPLIFDTELVSKNGFPADGIDDFDTGMNAKTSTSKVPNKTNLVSCLRL